MSIVFRVVFAALSLLGTAAVILVGMDVLRDQNPASADLKKNSAWLETEPLSTRPLTAQLIELIEAEKLDEAKPLADKLFDRNKRAVMARLVMAQSKLLEENDAEAFVDEFVQIFRLDRENEVSFAGLLAEQSRDDRVFAAVGPYLKDGPKWGRSYLKAVNEGEIQMPERMATYYAAYPREHKAYFETLIRRGNLDLAYLAFFQFLGKEATEYLSIPYDPEFLGYPGAAPFNWFYNPRYTSRRPNGSAEVSYFGGERPVLLSQIFPLSPGTYTLSAEMYGEASASRGYFSWQVQCLGDGALIADLPVENLSASPETFSYTLSVPSRNCAYQLLKLVGVPGNYPRTVLTEISNVSIERTELPAREPTE